MTAAKVGLVHADVAQELTSHGLVTLAGDRSRRNSIHYLASQGLIRRVLPGVFVAAGRATELPVLAAAVMAFDPAAVITGRAAAALSFWPDLPCTVLTAALPGAASVGSGVAVERRRIPPELVIDRGDLRITTPALTALDLCTTSVGPEAIDKVLQQRAATVDDLRTALELTPHRRGNSVRARLLDDVKTEGCSVLERMGHRTLIAGGLDEWVANRHLRVRGTDMRPDLRFTRRKLVIYFDGFTYHSSRAAFDTDREHTILLTLDGYIVLRVTWNMLLDPEEFVRRVRAALKLAAPY